MTNEENLKTEYMENVEIEFDEVEVNVSENTGDIVKIYFRVGEKAITWKPKVDTTEYREGVKVTSKKAMTIDKLPENVKKIAKICNKKGSCKCIVEYSQMTNTDTDKKYCFIRAESQLEKWRIVENDKTEVTTL